MHILKDVAAGAAFPAIPYYLKHFHVVCDSVEKRYGAILNIKETAFIARLRALDHPALCLYARLVNRKGPCFRISRLAYPEIENMAAAVADLIRGGFFRPCGKADRDALDCFDLSTLRKLIEDPALRRGGRGDLMAAIVDHAQTPVWMEKLLNADPVIRLAETDYWCYLRFLFFGQLTPNLSGFITRELGLIVPDAVDDDQLSPLFTTRAEARGCYEFEKLYEEFRNRRDAAPVDVTYSWWREKNIARADLPERIRERFDRLIMHLGQRLIKAGRFDDAIRIYRSSDHAPNREKLARLYIKRGDRDAALALLDHMAATPHDDAEEDATTVLAARLRKTSRRSPTRQFQQDSAEIIIDYEYGRVEDGSLQYFRDHGWEGVHSENWLWNAAFGLIFWDIVYDTASGAFHSPLQIGPADLYRPGFYARRSTAFETRLSLLHDRQFCRDLVGETIAGKRGFANPFVHWCDDLEPMVDLFFDFVPGEKLAGIFRHMAQDLKLRRRGFPDLFLWRDGAYRFIEIKSVNDTLAAHQYRWIRFLEQSGIDTQLIRVVRKEPILKYA